jgi:UDP-N-acetylmuramate: L-alanyl-gamma-D-glutamyl-meso-diaminopimelate ligase
VFVPVKSVHFIGIAGTAMAAAAVAMRDKGFRVTGSDENVYPPMSTFLAERQIEIARGYSEQNLAHRPDLVVIGNAISRGNPEAEYVLERRLRYCSLPELLKEYFLRGRRSLVVAGTHGKTTTTALLAWVFEHNGRRPSFLIGGLPNNFGQGARFTDSEWFIIEGDEYDTAFFDKRSKFVHYLPEVAILNNLEFDHADIFENLAAIQKAFSHLIRLVPRNGLVLANGDDPNLASLLEVQHCPVRRFGFGSANGVRAERIVLDAHASRFSVKEVGGGGLTARAARRGGSDDAEATAEFEVPLVGELNVRNALAVVACARHCGLTDTQIQAAFRTFTGLKRRQEVRGVRGGVTVVDDFGHHPTAIRETLRALRVRFPGRRLWAVFEPRSNTTRRNVFQRELAEALSWADAAVVSQVARLDQLPASERLDPDRLLHDLQQSARRQPPIAAQGAGSSPARSPRPSSLDRYLPTVDAIVDHLGQHARPGDVVCVFSNGGFGGIHEKLLARFGEH